MKSDFPERSGRQWLLPKRAIPLVWTAIVFVIQILVPWVIAQFGPRFGWNEQAPAWWNFAGLIVIAAGLAMYAWCLLFHFRSYRTAVRVSFSPPHLVTGGPYQVSRNPMYVSGLCTWLGWTIYFGSPAVLIALVLLWSAFIFRVIPHEEHLLEELFGQDYLSYKHSIRRWFGRY